MTFAQICKQHIAGQDLQCTHPDLKGIITIHGDDGQLSYRINGGFDNVPLPLYLSDFYRDDWHIV